MMPRIPFALKKHELTTRNSTLTTFYIINYLQWLHAHCGDLLECLMKPRYITEVSRINQGDVKTALV